MEVNLVGLKVWLGRLKSSALAGLRVWLTQSVFWRGLGLISFGVVQGKSRV